MVNANNACWLDLCATLWATLISLEPQCIVRAQSYLPTFPDGNMTGEGPEPLYDKVTHNPMPLSADTHIITQVYGPSNV